MIKLELYNGATWVFEKLITFEHYRKLISISSYGEGKEWRVIL